MTSGWDVILEENPNIDEGRVSLSPTAYFLPPENDILDPLLRVPVKTGPGGYRQLLALLCSIFLYRDCTIFWDEIDSSMHPTLVMACRDFLARHLRESSTRLVLVTHSSFFLSRETIPSCVAVTMKDFATHLVHLNKLGDTLSDFLITGTARHVLYCRKILWVEGKHDEIFIRQLQESVSRGKLTQLRNFLDWQAIPMHSKSNLSKAREFTQLLGLRALYLVDLDAALVYKTGEPKDMKRDFVDSVSKAGNEINKSITKLSDAIKSLPKQDGKTKEEINSNNLERIASGTNTIAERLTEIKRNLDRLGEEVSKTIEQKEDRNIIDWEHIENSDIAKAQLGTYVSGPPEIIDLLKFYRDHGIFVWKNGAVESAIQEFRPKFRKKCWIDFDLDSLESLLPEVESQSTSAIAEFFNFLEEKTK